MGIITTKESLLRVLKVLEATKGIFRILTYISIVLQATSLFFLLFWEQNKIVYVGVIGCGMVCTLVYMFTTEIEERVITRYLIKHNLSSVYDIFNSVTMGL